MQLDLEGRVKNVPERFMSNKPYMPLYEAIINSIQAIKEAKNDEGEIRVRIIRETTLDETSNFNAPIRIPNLF